MITAYGVDEPVTEVCDCALLRHRLARFGIAIAASQFACTAERCESVLQRTAQVAVELILATTLAALKMGVWRRTTQFF